MIRALVVFWGFALFALIMAALWTSGGSTSGNLGGTAFFVFAFGALGALAETARRDLL